ncbi:MAG: UPF0164 family protein [Alkalispirochaeta sp.]
MSRGLRTLIFFLAFMVPVCGLLPAGVFGQTFSDRYGQTGDWFDTEDVENTGLTVFPALSIPMGGEYEAMGTAYTAAARDVSFLEANPAASASLSYTELALFHSNLIADTDLEGLGYTARFDDLGFGVGGKLVHTPFTEYDDFGIQQGSARYVETIVAGNISYNFLNSFYFDGVSAGANLKAGYRRISRGLRDDVREDLLAVGVMIDVGLLSRLDFLKFYPSRDRNFAVGTVVRNLGPNVLGEPLPTQWSSGIAYSPLRPVLIGADITVPFTPFSPLPSESVGYAVGTAVTVTDFFTIRSGFQLKGGNPRITMGGSVDIQGMTVTINYTLDMTTQLTAFDRFSLQAGFSLGDRGRGEEQDRIRTLYLDALQAFAEGDLEKTINFSEQVVELDPRFQPAAETLEMAKRMQSLQEQMESIRTGDGTPPDQSVEQ